jgi:hypothetical protein
MRESDADLVVRVRLGDRRAADRFDDSDLGRAAMVPVRGRLTSWPQNRASGKRFRRE